MVDETKKPLLAAILNFIFPGLGYLYLGRRKNFGVLLVISSVLIIAATAALEWTEQDSLELPGGLVAMFAFAYDAYKTAQELNLGK